MVSRIEMPKRVEPFWSKFGGWKFGFGIIVGLVVSLIGIYALGIEWQEITREKIASDILNASTLFVAFVALVISFGTLTEQRRLRQAGTDPVLVAHLGQRADEPMVIMLNVSNVGAGAALNVLIEATQPTSPIDTGKLMTNVFERNKEIKVILQNSSVPFQFGMGPDLLNGIGLAPFEVNLTYSDIEGTKYRSSHVIDVNEMRGRPANAPASTQIWKELEKLRRAIEKSR